MYVLAVSEEDRKKGKSAGDVITFRYLGFQEGLHRLETVGEDGKRLDLAQCASPCKVIRVVRSDGAVQRIGFDTNSVIGGAFEDAIAGRLVAANTGVRRSGVENVPAIPASFLGEWNAVLEDCGTALNDSRLRVEPRRLRFYEMEGDVTGVTLRSSRAVIVKADFAGEGRTWQEQVELVLSRSGDELSVEGGALKRCPTKP